MGQSNEAQPELHLMAQAASGRHEAHEALVVDMTHVLQQQKTHIQVRAGGPVVAWSLIGLPHCLCTARPGAR